MSVLIRTEEILKLKNNEWLSITRESAVAEPPASVILCHGLTGDKVGPQKLLCNISKLLAIHCLVEVIRFDFRGSGLSSGHFQETDLHSMSLDSLTIANNTERPIIWIGLSTGALPALLACVERQSKEPLISVSNGLSDHISFTDLKDNPIPIRGGELYLNRNYFLERQNLKPCKNLFQHVGSVSVVLGSADHKHFKEAEHLKKHGAEVHTISEGDHLYTRPETRTDLFNYLIKKVSLYVKDYTMPHCQK